MNKFTKLLVIIGFTIIAVIGIQYVITERLQIEQLSNQVINDSTLRVVSQSSDGTQLGSAVIIKEDALHYYALTNEHVIENYVSIQVIDYYNNSYFADVYPGSINAYYDLAIISFDKTADLSVLDISVSYEIGDSIQAAGYPLSIFKITSGKITAIGPVESEITFAVIAHNALVNHGSSGGALLNLDNQIIGINYARKSIDGLFTRGYAIPAAKVLEYLTNIGFER